MPDAPTTPPAPAATQTGDPATPPAPSGQQATPPAPPAPDPAGQQQLADATTAAETATAERDQALAALDAIRAALDPDGAKGEADPAQLAATVAERDQALADQAAELRTARVELAAYRAAGEQGARADRLLNSRSFVAAVAQLDPADAKFGDQLAAAIKSTVEADPDLYRAAPSGPPRGGAQFSGPPATDRQPGSLRDAIAARLS
ncbi:hypothetical protein ACFC1B_27040 [Streptomyces xiamenensis]|uniref:hypothetical protein n=1 Tax=Streptomyces xiamenensis TaxID=408015 RepID=UPI0035E0EE03